MSRMKLEMLKPVIENVHGAAQLRFRHASGKIAAWAHHDRRGRDKPCQHQRLVAGMRHIGLHRLPVTDDDNAVGGFRPAVAAAQDRRPLPHLEKQLGDFGSQRRFSAATDCEVPDTDDGRRQSAAKMRTPLVIATARLGKQTVKKMKQAQ